MNNSTHEPLSASRAERLMQCPGSANLTKSIPGWEPPVVDEMKGAKGVGTIVHEALANIVSVQNAQQMLHVAEALMYVARIRQQRRFKVLIEETVEAPFLQQPVPTTVDLVLYLQDEIHIFDYKTGKIPVSPNFNKQLMYYAAIFMHLAPKAKVVHMHVVQPWADNITEHVISRTDIEQFISQLQITEQKLISGSTYLQSGEGCVFCPANPMGFGDKGRPYCPVKLHELRVPSSEEQGVLNLFQES